MSTGRTLTAFSVNSVMLIFDGLLPRNDVGVIMGNSDSKQSATVPTNLFTIKGINITKLKYPMTCKNVSSRELMRN